MKPEDVSVETTFLGGGFGRRIELDFIVQAAQISKAIGKPVKVLWSREDDMTHDFYRPAAYNQMAGGLDASGKPVALTFKVTSQSVTQRVFGLPKDTLDPGMIEAAVAPYDIANTKHDLVIHDSGMRVGYWRSVSHPFSVFANESFIDEMAKAAGKDPLEYRLALLSKAPRFANVLKEAAARGDWGKPVAAGRARGIAVMEGYESFLAMVVEASLKDGEVIVHKTTTVADLGHVINPDICEAQIESSIIFGLSAALQQEITIEKGRIQQQNYNTFPPLRMNQSPQIAVHLVKSSEKPGGVGEPAVALVMAATANALAALGKRVRSMPMNKEAIAKA
jgi:isoquinoline 1-oxidoreductase subunit beta